MREREVMVVLDVVSLVHLIFSISKSFLGMSCSIKERRQSIIEIISVSLILPMHIRLISTIDRNVLERRENTRRWKTKRDKKKRKKRRK